MALLVTGPVELLETAGGNRSSDPATAEKQEADRAAREEAPADEDPLGFPVDDGGLRDPLALGHGGRLRVERRQHDKGDRRPTMDGHGTTTVTEPAGTCRLG